MANHRNDTNYFGVLWYPGLGTLSVVLFLFPVAPTYVISIPPYLVRLWQLISMMTQ